MELIDFTKMILAGIFGLCGFGLKFAKTFGGRPWHQDSATTGACRCIPSKHFLPGENLSSNQRARSCSFNPKLCGCTPPSEPKLKPRRWERWTLTTCCIYGSNELRLDWEEVRLANHARDSMAPESMTSLGQRLNGESGTINVEPGREYQTQHASTRNTIRIVTVPLGGTKGKSV